MFVGLGTVANVVTVVLGSAAGLLLGNRLSERARTNVTDVLGLATIVIGGLNVVAVTGAPLAEAVGDGVGFLFVVGALLLGTLLGSWLHVEERLEHLATWLRARLTRGKGDRERFIVGFVTATLVFCVGPLAILGSLEDGLGRGASQLILKSILDGFAALAFASALGGGVLASALSVGVYQGALTGVAYALGDLLPAAHIDALSATGGVLLIGLGLRLLGVKSVRVADFLPALLFAPLLVQLVIWLR